MFGYPFGYSGYPDEYAQALAEERAARNQYAAALRAQDDARKRAARARMAQQAYSSPHNSYLPDAMDDYDDEGFLSGHSFPPGHGFGMSPQRRRALLEEQRRREMMELERQRVLEEQQKEALEEQRQQRLLEEEEFQRKMLEEQQAREAQRGRRQRGLEQFYRDLGLRVPNFDEPEVPQRRAHTASPVHRASAPSQSPQRESSPSPRPSTPTAEEIAAATKIQTFYRAHALHQKSLSELASLESRFEVLHSSFQTPPKVEFRGPNNEPALVDVTLPLPAVAVEESDNVPHLTYSSINAPVHLYEEELNRLLTALDAVESGGDHKIRHSRKELVKQVEKEAQRLESWKVAVWRIGQSQRADVQKDKSASPVDTDTSAVDETPEVPSEVTAPSTFPTVVEPEDTSISVTTAEEPFFDAASVLEPETSEAEVEDTIRTPSPLASPVTPSVESKPRKQDLRGQSAFMFPWTSPNSDVFDVFDML